MCQRIISKAVLILYLCMTAAVFADGPNLSPEALDLWKHFSQEVNLSLGIGFLTIDKPQKGADTEVDILPAVFYKKDRFYFEIKKGGYKLFEGSLTGNDEYSIDLIAQYRPDGYDSNEDFMLNGMSDRDPTVDGGISWVYDSDKIGDIEVSFLTDMLNNHNGKEIDVHYSIPLYIEKCRLAPGVGFKWLSGNLTNYYYGVKGSEVRGDRPKYEPGETTNLYLDLSYLHVIDKKWTLFSHLTYEWLASEIRKSPIVSEDETVTLFVGLMYNF